MQLYLLPKAKPSKFFISSAVMVGTSGSRGGALSLVRISGVRVSGLNDKTAGEYSSSMFRKNLNSHLEEGGLDSLGFNALLHFLGELANVPVKLKGWFSLTALYMRVRKYSQSRR
jgi:hypothetical protein